MKLRLSTMAFRSIAPVHPQVVEVDNEALTIGRATDNSFVVEDPERYCSRYHARCYLLNGHYFIEDSSSSGTLINESHLLERGHRYQLQHGDTLIIGENQLKVELIEQPQPRPQGAPENHRPAPPGAFSIDDFFADTLPEPAETGRADVISAPGIPTIQTNDFFQAPAPAASAPAFDFSDLAGLTHPVPEPEAAEPVTPKPRDSLGMIEDSAHHGLTTHPASVAPATAVAAPPVPPAAQPSAGVDQAPTPSQPRSHDIDTQAMKAFLKGLGLDPGDLIGLDKVQIMQSAGQMLKTLTGGLIDILQARADIKKEFSMDVTRIQATRNNPLKFCASTEEALLKLLTRDPAYLDPAASVQEGVIDAKAHQVAVMAGMQAAMESLLQRFDPAALEQQLDRRYLLSKKARYWTLYTKAYQQLVSEAEENFQALFGDEFARTYEEQVRQVASGSAIPGHGPE